MKPDPLGYPRNPLAVYLLALAFVSGLLQLLGFDPSRSVEDTLPPMARALWALLLVLGASASLSGIYWPGTVPTGLLLKRTGMFTLAVASFLYAIILLVAFGLAALIQSGIVLGLALACWLHYRQINDRVAQVVRMTTLEGSP